LFSLHGRDAAEHIRELWHEYFLGREEKKNRILMLFFFFSEVTPKNTDFKPKTIQSQYL
jgi:hypothetical protein